MGPVASASNADLRVYRRKSFTLFRIERKLISQGEVRPLRFMRDSRLYTRRFRFDRFLINRFSLTLLPLNYILVIPNKPI